MKKVGLIIGLGIVVRLLLMAVGIHPDIQAYNWAAYLIAQRGEILTFYDFSNTQVIFNYPPLAYLTHGLFNLLLWLLYPQPAWESLINNFDALRTTSGSWWLLTLLKLPYLLADVGILLLLRRLVRNVEWVWAINPFFLYSAYLMGQFDIFIGGLILLAVYLARLKGKEVWSGVSLGLAAGFKPITLALLPFLVTKRWWAMAAGIVTYTILILPYLNSVSFRHYALLASQTDKPLYAHIMVSGSQSLPVFIVGLVVLWWWNWLWPKRFSQTSWLAVVLLLFFSVTHWHPQWLAWIAPLLIVVWMQYKKARFPIGVLTGCWVVLILTFDNSLHAGLWGGQFSTAFLPANYGLDYVASLVRGVLAGTAITLAMVVKEPNA